MYFLWTDNIQGMFSNRKELCSSMIKAFNPLASYKSLLRICIFNYLVILTNYFRLTESASERTYVLCTGVYSMGVDVKHAPSNETAKWPLPHWRHKI